MLYEVITQAGSQTQEQPQVTKTIVRETPKINRNDVVTIKHVLSGKSETMKFKKAEPMLATGEWVIVNDVITSYSIHYTKLYESGSGKSTLMNILGCLDTPTSGSYVLNGKLVSEMHDDELAEIRNKEIGFVFQTFNLMPRTTALDNVALPMVYAGKSKEDRNVRATEVLTQVGLQDRMDHIV